MNKTKKLKSPLQLPKWTFAKVGKDYYLILKGKTKFISERAALSWNANFINLSMEALQDYPVSGRQGFRNGSILQNVQGETYFIEDGKRRLVTTPDFFDIFTSKPIKVSQLELEFHEKGVDIGNI